LCIDSDGTKLVKNTTTPETEQFLHSTALLEEIRKNSNPDFYRYGALYFQQTLKRLEETPKPVQPSITDKFPYYTHGTLPKLEIFDALLVIMQDKNKPLEHRALKPTIEFHIKHLLLIKNRKPLNDDYEFFLQAFQKISEKLNDSIAKNIKEMLNDLIAKKHKGNA
jgi:hypothetical protein